jgi:hypothetical protein
MGVRDEGGIVSPISVPEANPAPDRKLTTRQFRAFCDARQAVVSGAHTSAQNARGSTLSVVHDTQPKLSWFIPDFYFDHLRLRVPERVAQRLAHNMVNIAPDQRRKSLYVPSTWTESSGHFGPV